MKKAFRIVLFCVCLALLLGLTAQAEEAQGIIILPASALPAADMAPADPAEVEAILASLPQGAAARSLIGAEDVLLPCQLVHTAHGIAAQILLPDGTAAEVSGLVLVKGLGVYVLQPDTGLALGLIETAEGPRFFSTVTDEALGLSLGQMAAGLDLRIGDAAYHLDENGLATVLEGGENLPQVPETANVLLVLDDILPGLTHAWEEQQAPGAHCTRDAQVDVRCPVCGTVGVRTYPAEGHYWGSGKVTQEATCVSDGQKTYTCRNCGATMTKKIAARGFHNYTTSVVLVAPTCSTPGEQVLICADCDSQVTETLAPTDNHQWDEGTVTQEATCGEDGEKLFTCELCGETKTEIIPASEGSHAWDAGTVLQPATCGQAGEVSYTCAVCGRTRTEQIPATGDHAWADPQVTKEPTCTEAGVRTTRCTVCGQTQNTDLPALGHEPQVVSGKEPTCTQPGFADASVCARCGITLEAQQEIPPTGHQWNDGEATAAATCAKAGTMTYTCTVCGETKTEELPATGKHTWGQEKVTLEATCTEAGAKTYTCSVCGLTNSEALPALGHQLGDTVVLQEATCGKAGQKGKVCTRCGYQEVDAEPIPATGNHSYGSPALVEPTCTAAGTETKACSVCGTIQTRELPALGHVPEAVAGKEPTCTESGLSEGSVCSRCGAVITEQSQLPAAGHKWDAGKMTSSPCFSEGETTYTCTVCGTTKTEVIPANDDHTWGEAEVYIEATCGNDGLSRKRCIYCGTYGDQQVIPATGNHQWMTITEEQDGQPISIGGMNMTAVAGMRICSVCGEWGGFPDP